MLRLLRELRDERDRAGPPAEVSWHERSGVSRDPGLGQLAFSAAETAAIAEMARAAGATVHGALSAAWLLASAHRLLARAFAEAAHSVTEGVRARLARGEGELFYALTRPDAVTFDDDGLSRFRTLIDAAPRAIAVSNTGVLDDAGDPEWVRSMSFVLAPTPNQVAFAAATTYRRRLVINLATDRSRVDAAIVRRLMEEAAGWLGSRQGAIPS
jgi:hypothetical protein